MKPLNQLNNGSLLALKRTMDAYQRHQSDPQLSETFRKIIEALLGDITGLDLWAIREQINREDQRRSNQSAIRAIDHKTHEDITSLGPQELRVLTLIGQGYPPKEIAALLGISVHTVSSHKEHLVSKLGLGSMSQLTKFAINNINIIQP